MAEIHIDSELSTVRDPSTLKDIIHTEDEVEKNDSTHSNPEHTSPTNLNGLKSPKSATSQTKDSQSTEEANSLPHLKFNRLATMSEETNITQNLQELVNKLPDNVEILTEDAETLKAQNEAELTGTKSPKKSDASDNTTKQPETVTRDESELETLLEMRILEAEKIKDSAREVVKKGLHQAAIELYEASFRALRLTAKDARDSNFNKAVQLQNVLFTNIALCYSNMGIHEIAIRYCDRVLSIDNYNSKALYRRAVCLKQLNKKREAYESLKDCIEAFKQQYPKEEMDPAVVKLYYELREACKDELEREKKEEKERYARMLNQSPVKPKEEPKTPAPKDNPVQFDLFSAVSAVLTGVLASSFLKDKGVTGIESSAVGLATSAGMYTGASVTKKGWVKKALGALPIAAYLGYQIFKKK